MILNLKLYPIISSSFSVLFFCSAILGLTINLPDAEGQQNQTKLVFTRSGLVVELKPKLVESVVISINGLVVEPTISSQRKHKTIFCLSPYDWQLGQIYHLEIRRKSSGHLVTKQTTTSPTKPTPYLFDYLRLKQIWSLLPRDCRITTVDLAKDQLSIGTNKGHVAVWDLSIRSVIWKKRFSESIIKQVSLSPDGQQIYISEQSSDAWLSCYSLDDHDELSWRYRLANDVETSKPSSPSSQWSWLELPTATKFQWINGDLLVAATHVWPNKQGTNVRSQLYRLDAASGQIKWKFPADNPLPVLVRWFDISVDRLAFVCDKQSVGKQYDSAGIRSGSIVILNASDGQILFQKAFKPLEPYYKTVTFWRGVSITPNGKSVNITTDDGRAFLLRETDNEWREIWQTDLTTPIVVNQMPITATAGTVLATDKLSLFVTGDTFIPYHLQAGVSRPPMSHPNGMTLFAYQWNGQLAWQWELGNMPQGIKIENEYIVVASSDYGEAGTNETKQNALTVFDLQKNGTVVDKHAFTYRLSGQIPYDQIDISKQWIVCVETTSRSATKVEGKNQIHIIR